MGHLPVCAECNCDYRILKCGATYDVFDRALELRRKKEWCFEQGSLDKKNDEEEVCKIISLHLVEQLKDQ